MTHLPRSIPLHPMLAWRIARNGYGIGAVSGDEVIAFRYTDEAASGGPLAPPIVQPLFCKFLRWRT
jgi:hypothetical protein